MSSTSPWPRYLAALAVGLLLVPVKLVYSFLPGFNVVDVLVFGAIATLFAGWSMRSWWVTPILLVVPSVVLVALILRNLSWGELRAGIGTGWLLSLLLIPSASFAGAYIRQRRSRAAAASPHAT